MTLLMLISNPAVFTESLSPAKGHDILQVHEVQDHDAAKCRFDWTVMGRDGTVRAKNQMGHPQSPRVPQLDRAERLRNARSCSATSLSPFCKHGAFRR